MNHALVSILLLHVSNKVKAILFLSTWVLLTSVAKHAFKGLVGLFSYPDLGSIFY